jgi:hypothetical protein
MHPERSPSVVLKLGRRAGARNRANHPRIRLPAGGRYLDRRADPVRAARRTTSGRVVRRASPAAARRRDPGHARRSRTAAATQHWKVSPRATFGIESAAGARVCVAHRTPPPGENDIELANEAPAGSWRTQPLDGRSEGASMHGPQPAGRGAAGPGLGAEPGAIATQRSVIFRSSSELPRGCRRRRLPGGSLDAAPVGAPPSRPARRRHRGSGRARRAWPGRTG